MKKHRFYGGLFVTLLHIKKSCSYLTNTITNTTNYTPPLEQAKHAQAQLLAIHTTPDKKSSRLLRFLKNYKRKISGLLGLLWLWALARFYAAENRRRIPRWHLEDLALLKIIKTNALWLWNNHRPDRKIIRLEEWR
jgi:hypothetical protein